MLNQDKLLDNEPLLLLHVIMQSIGRLVCVPLFSYEYTPGTPAPPYMKRNRFDTCRNGLQKTLVAALIYCVDQIIEKEQVHLVRVVCSEVCMAAEQSPQSKLHVDDCTSLPYDARILLR